ncbi:MAG: carbohydrate ABC transporter permease [Defluviitaleaceae bacterium]|nr:carbohydrate ABC transporter permease [Defluviitaleaceae bacterium]
MKRVRGGAVIFTAGIMAVLFALPILVTVTNSFMTGFEIANRYSMGIMPANSFFRLEFLPRINFVRMTLVPDWFSLAQFGSLFRDVRYMDSLWNSVLITLPAVLGQIVVCVPAAYAFEFCKWRHKEKLFFVYLVVMLMPLPVILVPQFVIARHLGIDESVLAVILPAMFAPFGVFLLRQFIKTLPVEFIEAAKIDGAGQLRILASIVVPLLKPAIAALALLVFIDYWNVVDQAIVFITNPAMMPLSVYLSRLTGNFEIVFAASFFYMLPALLVFLHGQEQLISGMRMSGLK